MKDIVYNDITFVIEKNDGGWDISRKLTNEAIAVVGANLFADLPDGEARAQALIRTIFPVGIKLVGPDVAHPNRVGELRVVGPDVGHPNFVHWNEDSTSCSKLT